jgi:NAD(P)H-nitrite reductase large subunit
LQQLQTQSSAELALMKKADDQCSGEHRTVVLGAGRAAEALRQADLDGDTVVIGRERHPPYGRPPVSKALRAGTAEAATAYFIERGIKLRLGCEVAYVDRGSTQRLNLDGGERLATSSSVSRRASRRSRNSAW